MARTIDRLDEAIRNELMAQVREEVDHIVKEAQEEIEKRIRRDIAQSVMAVNRFYSMEQMGDLIKITVQIDSVNRDHND